MKSVKKSICIFLSVLMCLSTLWSGLSVISFATDRTVVESGSCGENANYVLYSDGELVISGTGATLSLESVDESPFYDVTGITKLTFEEGITNIYGELFKKNSAIATITIPLSVTYIAYDAFDGCTAVTDVYYAGSQDQWNEISSSNDYFEGATIHFADTRKIIEYNQLGNDVMYYLYDNGELHVKGSGEIWDFWHYSPFENIELIRSVVIEEGITKIGERTFHGCSSLSDISIPDSVITVGREALVGTAFYNDASNWENDILYYGDRLIEARKDITGSRVIRQGTRSISHAAFMERTELTGIVIPDSVTHIDGSAFRESGLTSVVIPDSVKIIEDYVFYECYDLSDITLPDGIEYIGDRAFQVTSYYYDSSNWENDVLYIGNHLIEAKSHIDGTYTVKPGTKTIAAHSFFSCEALDKVILPDGLTHICDSAFQYCESLKNMTLPYGLNGIGVQAFYSCSALESVSIPDTVRTIDRDAFHSCVSLAEVIIPGSVTHIGDSAFNGCTGLVRATIADGVKTIGTYAFWHCENLTDVTIGNTVTEIGMYAFKDCSGLTSITVPASVAYIYEGVFEGCSSLESITLPFIGASNESNEYGKLVYLFGISYPDSFTNLKQVTITAPCERINNAAFYGWASLTSITLPDTLKTIGYNAFANCSDLTSVTIPDGVEVIDDCAFEFCTNLTDITIADSVSEIGACAFENTAYYNDISNWDNGLLYIDNHLIRADTSIVSCDIRQDIKSIASGAFSYCSDIYEITIPNGITKINDGTFMDCSSLKSVTIPDTVTNIGASAFSYCRDLENITIPNSVKTIDDCVFYCCYSLKNIAIPYGVTTISDYMFQYCESLISIAIPISVTYVSRSAFESTDLQYVFYTGTEDDRSKIKVIFADNSQFRDAFWHYQATDHSYGTFTTVEEPTCSEYGYKERICSVCGYVDRVDIEKTEHEEAIYEATAPTCTSYGYTEGKYCSVCDQILVYQELIEPYGHDIVILEGQEATCTESGITDGQYCTVCGRNVEPQQIVPAKGHTAVTLTAVAATCTKAGKTAGKKCADCGVILVAQETVAAKGHTLTTVKGKAATCTATGLTDGKKCSVCGTVTVKQETIAKKAHTIVTVKGKASTCTATGLTDGKKCSVCGTVTVKQETIAKKGHTLTTVKGKAATCTATGLTDGKKCSVCGTVTVKQETIAKKAHTIVTVKGKASTCTATGLTDGKKCSVCGTVTVAQKTIAKKAHTYRTTTTKATLTQNGKTVTKCSVCGVVSKTTTVYYPKTIALSATSGEYNGKAKTPTVTVKDSKGNTLKKDTDYTVKYESGRKNPGKYDVTVTFKGKYSGTKKLSFVVTPQKTSKVTATQTTTSVTLKWNKVTGATGYRVFQKVNGKWKTLTNTTKLTYTIKKLKAGTKYSFAVRPYSVVGKDTILASAFTQINTTTKCKTPTLKLTSTKKGVANASWTNVAGETGYELYGSSKKSSGFKKLATTKMNVVKASKNKLTSKKTYYFKVRAYTKTDSGTVYSAWSDVKSVKIK